MADSLWGFISEATKLFHIFFLVLYISRGLLYNIQAFAGSMSHNETMTDSECENRGMAVKGFTVTS